MFQRENLSLVVSLVKGHHEAIRDQLNKTVFDFDSLYLTEALSRSCLPH